MKIASYRKPKMEPDLESEAGNYEPWRRRALADKLRRFAHQLDVTADVIEAHSIPPPRPMRVHWLPAKKAAMN